MPQQSALTQLSDTSKTPVIEQFKQELADINATDEQKAMLQQKFGIGDVVLTPSEKLLIEREERRGATKRK